MKILRIPEITRCLFTICLVIVAALCGAQNLIPLPSDLSEVPNLGIDRSEAVYRLNKVINFSEIKESSGLINVTGTTASGTVRVNFKCAGDKVVAASIAVPPTNPVDIKTQAIKHGILLRFMMNLVPEHDRSNPNTNPLGGVIAQLSRFPEKTWSIVVDDKFIFANRELHPGLVSIGVLPRKFREKRYNIGNF